MRILVAEDEVTLADTIASGLRRRSLAVDVVYNGRNALEQLRLNSYDVLVLDRDMPEVHGDVVCQIATATHHNVRILMLTAAGEIRDRVSGLALGADDYLPKPFAFAELDARIRALGRRARPSHPPILTRGGISLDTANLEVKRDGRPVILTRKEFCVLQELMIADGAVVSSEQLLEKAWDENANPFTNAFRMTVMTLRRKLGQPAVIRTIAGVGYQIP